MTETVTAIEQLAIEFRRLDPEGCGEDAGYRSCEGNSAEWPSVGWYGDGANVGHSVVSVHADDLLAAVAVLREYTDGEANVTGPSSWSYDPAKRMKDAGVRCKWHV